jgi:hypothetical protein
MNKSILGLLICFLLCSFNSFAQPTFSYKQADWQQHVDYTIQVTLDDQNHLLLGNINIKYINNSPDDLKEFYIHLWPNGYQSNKSAFAVQKDQDNDAKFITANQDERGYIDSLSFIINGKKTDFSAYQNHQDIAYFKLETPLASGDSFVITTPFKVKIPGSFSRLGHEKQAYQISQWYPKPAVYDINGWNPMPYLDQGEFYSEFGTFNVAITLPANYVIAATGEIQEDSEKEFIKNRLNNPIDPTIAIASSQEKKTVTFVQNQIHDFAWFASKTFNVERNKVTLKSGKVVETFVYASLKKINYCNFINDALLFYSNHSGEYPYKYCSVVLGSLKAGGGMEYPMITVCDFLSEDVIVHEVGHNWFYGILGSNERTYPWMDESVNSYFEGETTNKKEPSTDAVEATLKDMASNAGGMKGMAIHAMKRGTDQAPGDESEVFTGINYGTMVYGKGAFIFYHLKAYLGDELFYDCFRAYFDKWKFKHPLPDDMQEVFEKTSGKKLSWFFRDMIFTTKTVDYGFKSVTKTATGLQLELVNKGAVNAPFPIDFIQNNKIIKTVWLDGFSGTKSLNLEIDPNTFDRIQLDAKQLTPDINTSNNNYFAKSLFHFAEKPQLSLVTSTPTATKVKMNLLPAYGFNLYNKSMLGLGFHNIGFPGHKTEYIVLPLYSFETKDINGYAQLYHIAPIRKKNLQNIEYGVKAARFAFNNFDAYTYNKINPYLKFHFSNPKFRGSRMHDLTARFIHLNFDPNFNTPDTVYANTYKKAQNFIRLEYDYKRKTAIRPEKLSAVLESGFYEITNVKDNFIKLSVTAEKILNYKKPKKGLTIRGFAGVFIKEAKNSIGLFNYAAGSYNGRYDYLFDHSLMGRSANNGLFQNQILGNEGNQKYRGAFGGAGKYMLTLNAVSTLPGKIPLRIYADAMTFNDIDELGYTNAEGKFINTQLFYQLGITVPIIPNIFEINVPLLQSEVVTKVQELQNVNNFTERITFVLKLNLLEPREFIKNVKLF